MLNGRDMKVRVCRKTDKWRRECTARKTRGAKDVPHGRHMAVRVCGTVLRKGEEDSRLSGSKVKDYKRIRCRDRVGERDSPPDVVRV